MKPEIQYRPKPRVAQRLEHAPYKREVAGSNPAASTTEDAAAVLERIREKTRLRVQKHRATQRASE